MEHEILKLLKEIRNSQFNDISKTAFSFNLNENRLESLGFDKRALAERERNFIQAFWFSGGPNLEILKNGNDTVKNIYLVNEIVKDNNEGNNYQEILTQYLIDTDEPYFDIDDYGHSFENFKDENKNNLLFCKLKYGKFNNNLVIGTPENPESLNVYYYVDYFEDIILKIGSSHHNVFILNKHFNYENVIINNKEFIVVYHRQDYYDIRPDMVKIEFAE